MVNRVSLNPGSGQVFKPLILGGSGNDEFYTEGVLQRFQEIMDIKQTLSGTD